MSHLNPNEPMTALTDDGRRRRDAMRLRLCDEVRIVHRSRQRRHHMTGASLLCAIAAVGGLVLAAQFSETGASNIADAPTIPVEPIAPHTAAAPRIAIVKTNASIAEKYRIDRTPQPQWLTDEELLDAMNEIGQSAGLIRTRNATLLVHNHPR